MQRRRFILSGLGLGLAAFPTLKAREESILSRKTAYGKGRFNGLEKPVFVYNNWSAYDELSDNVAQTESLAMRELNEILRLKNQGVQIDYYVMDAFWFDKAGGYRSWHKKHWPNGPGNWLKACRDHNIKPGMWFSTNLVRMGGRQALDIIPPWQDSLATDPSILCLFEGGYLQHLSDSLQFWYDQGVRLFKFDFAYFEAATAHAKQKYSPEEVQERNKTAFMGMIGNFRTKNQDVIFTGYNGFGAEMENTFTPFKRTIDERWMGTFDTIYSGDPRFSDVPMMNIWRSQDNYSDHMVRQFQFNGLPLRRIDNCAFMIGKTGTCYYRATQCWKGMLILELARGGWMNVYHGNLELLSDADAAWFARVQSLFYDLQKEDAISSFGAIPGTGQSYGFAGKRKGAELYTVVNPSQLKKEILLPAGNYKAKILYADGGYLPVLTGKRILLGPEQLAVVGYGKYAEEIYDLGRDETIIIPQNTKDLMVEFKLTGKNQIEGILKPGSASNIRILFQQFDKNGFPHRSWGGAPPDGKKMDEYFKISGEQSGKPLPAAIEYDKMIWSGLSWAVAEIKAADLVPDQELIIRCSSAEADPLDLKASLYAVDY